MKSALLLSHTEALEEEPETTEQERDGLEVDCGAQPLALIYQLFSKFLKFQIYRHSSMRSGTCYRVLIWCRLHTVLLPREAENMCA